MYAVAPYSDGKTALLKANGTHKNQLGQAEGGFVFHKHIRATFLVVLSRTTSSLSFLSAPLKPRAPFVGGVPLVSMVTIQYDPVGSLGPAPPVLAGDNGCHGDQSRVNLCPVTNG